MKLRTKRVTSSLPLPTYEKGAACFDFLCRTDVTIPSHSLGRIPVNQVIEVPEGYTMLVIARSGTPHSKSLMLANGIGVLDSFFSGESDEIQLLMYNISNKDVDVKRVKNLLKGCF